MLIFAASRCNEARAREPFQITTYQPASLAVSLGCCRGLQDFAHVKRRPLDDFENSALLIDQLEPLVLHCKYLLDDGPRRYAGGA